MALGAAHNGLFEPFSPAAARRIAGAGSHLRYWLLPRKAVREAGSLGWEVEMSLVGRRVDRMAAKDEVAAMVVLGMLEKKKIRLYILYYGNSVGKMGITDKREAVL